MGGSGSLEFLLENAYSYVAHEYPYEEKGVNTDETVQDDGSHNGTGEIGAVHVVFFTIFFLEDAPYSREPRQCRAVTFSALRVFYGSLLPFPF